MSSNVCLTICDPVTASRLRIGHHLANRFRFDLPLMMSKQFTVKIGCAAVCAGDGDALCHASFASGMSMTQAIYPHHLDMVVRFVYVNKLNNKL